MAKQKGTDLDEVASNGGNNRQKISDVITLFKFPEKKWVTLRLHGPIFTYGGYWVTTKTKEGKKTKFYTPAPSYDPSTQQRDSTIYDPWRDLEAKQADMERDDKTLNFATAGFLNGIFRTAQRDAPRKQAKHTSAERKSGFKDKDSDSYTPNVAIRLPYGALQKMKDQSGLNVVEVKGQTKAFPVTHPKYGCDVRIMYNPDKAPADQYSISIGERKPLTEEELALLKWDLSELETAPGEAEVKRDFESWAKRNGVKVGGKKSKKSKDEDDEDFPDDDGDDEEDEPKSKKKKSKSKKAAKDEDEDDDFDDEDEEDEDEDDEPKSKKSKKKPVAKGKKKPVDDDEDEDDFDDEDSDDDDEEDEPSPKSKKKPAKGKKKVVEDDDEDDFDDEDDEESDDDEDDEPKSKKSKKKPAAKSKKKKPVDDDEDDFDDDEESDDEDDDSDDEDDSDDDEDDEDDSDSDEDDDEDDEEEEKPKSKSKKKVKKDVKKDKKKKR